jgi:hypothetical protein
MEPPYSENKMLSRTVELRLVCIGGRLIELKIRIDGLVAPLRWALGSITLPEIGAGLTPTKKENQDEQ